MDFEKASETTESNKHICKLHFINVMLFDYRAVRDMTYNLGKLFST